MAMKVMSFSTGLEEVFVGSTAPVSDFPTQKHLLISGDSIPSHTRDLFDAQTVDQQLVDFVRPLIRERSLMSPEGFNRHYQSAAIWLEQQIENLPEQSGILSQAKQLLAESEKNVDLLTMYRNLLLQA